MSEHVHSYLIPIAWEYTYDDVRAHAQGGYQLQRTGKLVKTFMCECGTEVERSELRDKWESENKTERSDRKLAQDVINGGSL